jgi:CelD/BcsL family acetyltransferase involved in cellulose biosynthesis
MSTSSAAIIQCEQAPLEREIRVQVVSRDEEFLALEPIWDRVLDDARRPHPHPFLEFQWARDWWECFGHGNSLHILVVWLGEEPVAIAPLMLSRVRVQGIPVHRLGFLYNSHVPRADFLIGKYPELAYRAIWRYLRENRCWDILQLCQLPDTSATLPAISRLAESDGFGTGTWDSGASPSVDTSGSWLDYFNSLPAKHRSNLRNRLKRIAQLGEIEREVVCTPSRLEGALEDGFRIEASAWKGSAGTAIACVSDLRRFYSVFARHAAERGWLRLNFLRAGDRRVAFDYSLVYHNRTFLLKLGYDPELSAYSPSQLLLSMALQDAFEQGHEEYDFLGEFVDWKRSWARESTSHRWLFVTRPGIKGRLFHFAKFRAIPLLKSLSRRG